MKRVELRSRHNFSKKNLVTHMDGTDTMVCTKCGITGSRRGVNEYIMVRNRYSDEKIRNCDGSYEDDFLGLWCEVISCGATTLQFENLKKGSVHQIVTPPEGYYNGERGVWVQGVGEPVKMLFDEFNMVSKPVKVEDPDAWYHDYFEEKAEK